MDAVRDSVTMSVSLEAVTEFLDTFLDVDAIPDYTNALNGLQVENSGTVGHIVAAVDASHASIDAAAAESLPGNGLLVVHHGLFWDGNVPLTGRRYRRIKALVAHDLALYSAHLPLDLHPEVGNNVQLANRIGLAVDSSFGDYQGVSLGVAGALSLQRDDLVARLNEELCTSAKLLGGGPASCRRVGIITGGAGSMIADAVAAGCDTFITGEGAHHTYFDAHEWGINVIYAGHYATEQLGVQALAAAVGERFGIPWVFHDHPTGL